MDMPALETPVCDLCGNAEQRVLFAVKDRRHRVPGEFDLVECTQCSLRYLSPRPTAAMIASYYPNIYKAYKKKATTEGGVADFLDDIWNSYLKLFLNDTYPTFFFPRHEAEFTPADRAPRVCDVGCGSGDKLRYIRRHSKWQTFGVDFSPQAVENANARGAGDVKLSTGDRLPFDDNFFDGIMSWHSLEHHYSPKATMREVARVLRPGGYGIFAVPSGDNLGLKMFRGNWGPLEAPRHLYHFTEDTLKKLMSDVGLTVHETYYDFSFYGLFLDQEIFESIQFFAEEHGLPLQMAMGILRIEGLISSAATLPILPLNKLLGRFWRGTNLIVHFRKS